MKKILLFNFIGLLFFAGCWEDTKSSEITKNLELEQEQDKDHDPDDPKSLINNREELLKSAKFLSFKNNFEEKFSSFKTRLPEDQIYRMISSVDQQARNWNCGLVQCSIARASSHIISDLGLENTNIKNPNKIDPDYPMLLNIEYTSNIKNLVGASKEYTASLGKKLDVDKIVNGLIDDEDSDGKKYLRIGANPAKIPAYLKKKLPKNIDAQFERFESLTEQELQDLIKKNVAIGMPLIALTNVENKDKPDDFEGLHYLSIAGYEGDNILYIETQGLGMDRLHTSKMSDFISRMNLSKWKNEIGQYLTLLVEISESLKNATAPTKQDLNDIGNFNLIGFKKVK